MVSNWLEIVAVVVFACLIVNAWADRRYTALYFVPLWIFFYWNALPAGSPAGSYLQIFGLAVGGYIIYIGATRERSIELISDLYNEAVKANGGE